MPPKRKTQTKRKPAAPSPELEEQDLDIQGPTASGDELEVQGQDTGSQSKKTLTDEQEEEMVEWIVNTPMLYDKKLTDYRDKAKRIKAWNDQAVHLGVTPDELTTWYRNMRTVFGKLREKAKKPKSGDGASALTERQTWVMKSFNFLVPHIVRHPGRAGGIGP